MKKARVFMVWLCMFLVLFVGCTGNQKTKSVSENKTVKEEVKEDVKKDVKEEVKEDVTITYLRPGTEVENNGELLQAINDKLKADGMNLKLEIMYIPSDVFQDKLNMMLSTGDEFDLLCIMEDQKPFTSFVANEGIISITKYVEKSENLNRVIPSYMWESATINGEIYTIPANWCETADQNCCITFRRDKMKEFGLEDPQTKEDLLNMCKVFAENWKGENKPVVIPMYKEPFNYLFRTLDTYPFTVQKDLFFIDQQGNVKNWMETEEFKQCAEFFRELYEKGYVPEDVLSSGWSSWKTMLTGDFIWVDQCQLWDTEAIWEERIPGVELDTVYLNPKAPIFRMASFRNDTAVSSTSKYPEEAVKFMDWLYSSQENYDLMVYGIEGVTWKNEGGNQYTKIDPAFEFNPDWMIGNLNYIRYQKGTYEKFIDIMGKEKPEAQNAIGLNFVFDPSAVADEYVTCQAEVVQSVYPIKLGLVSYEEGYKAALERMKAAGIDKVIEEYQKQMNEYLKQKGNN